MDLPSIASTAALALAGWALKQASKVASIESDVAEVKADVKTIVNHLISKAIR